MHLICRSDNSPLSAKASFRLQHQSSSERVSDSVLAKLVVTVILFLAFTTWVSFERDKAARACNVNCPTDLSANRKQIRQH
jgi:hypothetical protein